MIGKTIVGVLLSLVAVGVLSCGDNIFGGDTQPVPLVPVPIRDWRAAWNPVADVIAYEHTPVSFNDPVDAHSKIPGIYLINSDGTNDHLVIYGGSNPSWSPSGDTIAHISRFDSDLYLYSISLDASTRLTSSGNFNSTSSSASYLNSTSYSGDGKYIAVATIGTRPVPSRVIVVDVQSGDTKVLRSGSDYDNYNWQEPRWIAGQPTILFSLSGGSLCIVDALTDKVVLFREHAEHPAISFGGDSISFIQTVGFSYETILLDIRSRKEVKLGQRFVECFSRDGSKLIFTLPKQVVSRGIPKDKYYLYIYDLKTGRDVQLTC